MEIAVNIMAVRNEWFVDECLKQIKAAPDAQTSREGMEAGGCAFLTKPYQMEELQAAVAGAVTENTKSNIHIEISAR